MKTLIKNLIVIFWGAILGLVLGYIGSQLESMTTNYTLAATLGADVACLGANCISFMTFHANPEHQ